MKLKLIIAGIIGLILFGIFWYFDQLWIGIVAVTGPTLAVILSALGVTGAGIMTFLSFKGKLPIVAVVGFLITFVLFLTLVVPEYVKI
ncbi:MAG: hypothetical protein E6Q60_02320 [Nitrosomonas oligotropha]|uniref:Uncharacterized protein n=1 Tax=Nitrosomonas oligotropha TaxID=42354 RepID=A0A5C7W172_9PROT|nr:MAG: hypothetical protein E6Q60_02320 [Nitrosomonas oligotropha]